MAKESTFLNMLLSLFLVCLICSGILGGVYAITKKPIDTAQLAKKNNAISTVVPEFDNVPSQEQFSVEVDGKSSVVYPAKKGGVIVGYAIESSTSKGFGGAIVMMVGFSADGSIYNSSVISHSETPGLGDKMVEGKSNFSAQFKGKNPANFKLSVKKDGGDVDAITASTITSRAYCDALERAYKVFCSIEKGK
jgi:Na+-translocating ferredoxin:NAD+ oxidoreductase subunit G